MKQRLRKNPTEILENIYKIASVEVNKDGGKSFLGCLKKNQREWLTTIVSELESFKAVMTVLVTSLVKKIENPRQDIRYHKEALRKGYSGRTLDTRFITPFFKKRFRRFAMKESGWLTRSLEQPHPFTLSFPGKIRNKVVKESFLQILNDLESRKANPKKYLIALFILLILKTKEQQLTILQLFPKSKKEKLTIDLIIESLKSHFFQRYRAPGASRLPVIAIYSIYQLLLNDVNRYKNKKLLPLKSHVASDVKSKGIGDIEVLDNRGKYFEGVEIKYQIPIDDILVQDAYNKFKNLPINRYYLLTTKEPNIKPGNEQRVKDLIRKIRHEHGCEVIVNGLINSVKYYLRLLKDPAQFIESYSKNLKQEVSKSTVIKIKHLKAWEDIISKSKL